MYSNNSNMLHKTLHIMKVSFGIIFDEFDKIFPNKFYFSIQIDTEIDLHIAIKLTSGTNKYLAV